MVSLMDLLYILVILASAAMSPWAVAVAELFICSTVAIASVVVTRY